MSPMLRQILKRGLIAAGLLGLFGFALAYLIQSGVDTMSPGLDASPSSPFPIALAFAAVGFALLVVLEGLAALYRSVRRKKPPPTG